MRLVQSSTSEMSSTPLSIQGLLAEVMTKATILILIRKCVIRVASNAKMRKNVIMSSITPFVQK
jgi:hypothetical protein